MLLVAEVGDRRARGEAPTARDYLPRFPAHTHVVRNVLPDAPPRPAPTEGEDIPEARRVEPPACAPEPTPLSAGAWIARSRRPSSWRRSPLESSRRRSARQSRSPGRFPAVPGRGGDGWSALRGLMLVGVTAAVLWLTLRPRPKHVEGPPAPPGPTAPGPAPKAVAEGHPQGCARPARNTTWPSGSGAWAAAAWSCPTAAVAGRSAPRLPSRRSSSPSRRSPSRPRPQPGGSPTTWNGSATAKLSSIQLHAAGPLTEATLAPLAGLPLRTLELNAPSVQVSGTFLARFPGLETLLLPRCPDFGDVDLAAVGKLGKLSAFAVNSPRLTVSGFMELPEPGAQVAGAG